MQKAREAKGASVEFARAIDLGVSYTADRNVAMPADSGSQAQSESGTQTDAAGQGRSQEAAGDVPPCCRGGHQTPTTESSESSEPADSPAAAVDEAIRALQAEEPEGAVHAAMVDWRTLIAVGAVGLSYLATQHLTRTRNRSARDPREATELLRQQPDLN
jgi:hypothetical protein